MAGWQWSPRVQADLDAERADALALALACIAAHDYAALDALRARLCRQWDDGMAAQLIRDAYAAAWPRPEDGR